MTFPQTNQGQQQQTGQTVTLAEGAKPTWRGMKDSSYQIPVREFVGLLTRWDTEDSPFGGTNVLFQFGNCQIILTDAPYPHAEVEVPIKYSERKNSAWGSFGQTVADVLGVDVEGLEDPDPLIGKWIHMERFTRDYGINRQTGQQMTGQVWNCKGVSATPPGMQNAQVQQVQTDPNSAQVVQNPPAQAQQTTTTSTGPVDLPLDPRERAEAMLPGKNYTEFVQATMQDTIIQNSPIATEIINRTFTAGLESAGRIAVDNAGVFFKPGG